MARVPQEEIDRLKREVSVERLARNLGIKLKELGCDLHGLCPWHDDHDPSLVISRKKNLWHCLGACRMGGSSIDFVMKAYGVEFRHAVELMRGDLPPTPLPGRLIKHSSVKHLPSPVSVDAEDAVVLKQLVDYYHETLKQSPEALAYLERRGLKSWEAIEHFKLGYANRTLGYRLPDSSRKAGEAERGRLERLGIMRASGHEHFNGSIVVPIFGADGHVTEMYGRKVRDNLRKGTPLHLYLPGPHRGFFNLEAVKAAKEVILCEALLDALTFWCAGFRNVTASYGVEGFTEDHTEAFKRFAVERVLIAYDRDEAGDRAATALAEKLLGHGMSCYRIQFPKGMDANEYALKVQPAAKSLGLVIRKAEWLGRGKAPAATLTSARVASSAPDQDQEKATKVEEAPPLAADNLTTAAATSPAPLVDAKEAARGEGDVPLASPEPPPARPPDIDAEVKPDEVLIHLGDRHYRVRGLPRNVSYNRLDVNLLVTRDGVATQDDTSLQAGYFVDTLNLYVDLQRRRCAKQAAFELRVEEAVVRKDLGKVLLKLEEVQDQRIKEALKPVDATPKLSDDERREALALLEDPNLLSRILTDFERSGVVGEETNKLVAYLAAVSRKLEEPLAVMVQSSSAAGKSSLMEAVLAFVPEEERVKYSAMTGQSLFYMKDAALKHKVLAIVEEEGAERASYALKLLQSEGELTIASTGKDAKTGRLETQEYHVEGPVMILSTTTAIELDEELLNRCIVLTVDEGREQTKAIHRLQRKRETLAGLLARRDRDRIVKIHRNAQRLLRPLLVANPFAEDLDFIDDRTRTRRDHKKYLTLIRAVALLHQYQRKVETTEHEGEAVSYIEATLADIAVANRLAAEVLGRSLDELSPQTRALLVKLDEMVKGECKRTKMDRTDYRFSRKDVRQYTGFSPDQLQVHMNRLVDLEYVLVHRGGRGQSFEYEILYDGRGQDGKPFLMRLIDVGELERRALTTERTAGSDSGIRGSSGGHLAPIWGGSAAQESATKPELGTGLPSPSSDSPEKALPRAAARAPRLVVTAAGRRAG